MINAKMMYLRPGNLFQDFYVVRVEPGLLKGQPVENRIPEGTVVSGCIEEATPEEKIRWEQPQHPITHSIVQAGSPKAKAGWILEKRGKAYRIQGVDSCGDLGIATIYYVEERGDCSAGVLSGSKASV